MIAGLILNAIGFVIVGLFVTTWAVAVLVWRYGRIEQKWAAGAAADVPTLEDRAASGLDTYQLLSHPSLDWRSRV